MSDIVERLVGIVENIPSIILSRKRQDELETISEAVDTITALRAEVEGWRNVVSVAREALCEYACHAGTSEPCIRSPGQCASECGKEAGDAIVAIDEALGRATRAALTQTKDTTDDA